MIIFKDKNTKTKLFPRSGTYETKSGINIAYEFFKSKNSLSNDDKDYLSLNIHYEELSESDIDELIEFLTAAKKAL